jgi:hypothetical protein
MTKPMSAPMLIQCLAGELYTDPGLLVETIKEDPETLALVREYGAGREDYATILERVSELV